MTSDVRPPGTINAFEYDVEFTAGPLHMDLEADESDRPTVLAFSTTAAGDMGPAQATGKIEIGDALVKCNEEDLSDYDFTDAISIVIGTPWPRIMTFERPAAEPVPDAEGWLFKQGSESTSTLRRRMVSNSKRKRACTVVDISIPPPSFKAVSLTLSRSPLF